MAFEAVQHKAPGLSAGADLSSHQYKFVKISAANTVILCAAVTDHPYGVLQNSPVQGQAAEVCCHGLTKVIANQAISAGASIGTDASGLAAPYTAADTTKYIVGECQDVNAAANGLIVAWVSCPGARTLA